MNNLLNEKNKGKKLQLGVRLKKKRSEVKSLECKFARKAYALANSRTHMRFRILTRRPNLEAAIVCVHEYRVHSRDQYKPRRPTEMHEEFALAGGTGCFRTKCNRDVDFQRVSPIIPMSHLPPPFSPSNHKSNVQSSTSI